MATKVTLDSIREAAERQYGSYDIEIREGFTVRLLNPLRLSKEVRDKLSKIDDKKTEDVEASLVETLRLLAATPGQADALLAELGGDLALLAVIFEQYAEQTELGEASVSQG